MLTPRRALQTIVWAFALFGLASYVWLARQRIGYPLELDFIEGVMMDHIARLAHGQPIYVEPTLRFIPLAYMPFFSVVAAAVTHVMGVGFAAPRLVSFVSTLFTAGLIAGIVKRETRRTTLAVGAAGVYATAFAVTGACYDVARPDSLMLLITFSGLAVLRYTRGVRGALVAAALLTLGFFTKQHAVLFCFGALAYLFFHERRRFLPFLVAIVAGCGGGYFVLDAWLGDWFRMFTWSIPRGWSTFNRFRVEHYVGGGVLGMLACSTVPALLSLAVPDPEAEKGRALWYWTGLAAVGTGLLATLDPSAYLHVFTPTVVALSILGPIALDRIGRRLDATSGDAAGHAGTLVLVVLAAQFLPLAYSIGLHRPRPHAAAAHAELIQRLRALQGHELVPYHGWYSTQAGGSSSLQFIALDDIVRSHGNPILRRDPEYLDKMFRPLVSGPGRPAIFFDYRLEHSGHLWQMIEPGYRLADSLDEEMSSALRPLTGNQHSITYIYVPREPAPPDSAR